MYNCYSFFNNFISIVFSKLPDHYRAIKVMVELTRSINFYEDDHTHNYILYFHINCWNYSIILHFNFNRLFKLKEKHSYRNKTLFSPGDLEESRYDSIED